jgi:NodT family efflux transporter outer membrane factor (OMF) lipoprotein
MISPARLLLTPLLTVLAACTVGPDFRRPQPDLPARWSAAAPPAAASRPAPAAEPGTAWWNSFGDPTLASLIARAAAANLDLRQAELRISEARAQLQAAGAALWPNLNANASWQRQRISEGTPQGRLFSSVGQIPGLPTGANISIPNPYSQYQLGFDASWEIDLFGHVRRGIEAARASEAAAVEDSHDARLSVFAEVARTYVDLRGAQQKRAVTQAILDTQAELLDLARQRRAAGLSSDIDVSRAAAQAAAAKAQLPLLDRQITADINALSRLIDREPGALRTELAAAAPVPPVPPEVPVGLPADLARRRPDIRAAEARLHAATAQEGVAVAELFPRLTLSASGGYQSGDISSLLDWASRFGMIGPRVELPIFDAGRRRANVKVQDARARQAAVGYARTVLGALHEADNALTAYDSEQQRRAALMETVEHNRTAVTLARQRWTSGVASFLDVLDAERTLQQNELLLADSTTAVSTDLVALYKALGGGWEAAPAQAAASPAPPAGPAKSPPGRNFPGAVH